MLSDSKETNICCAHLRVREVYDYDSATGIFKYKINRGSKRAGDVAGTLNADGYVQLRFENKLTYAHRLAFLWMTGEWPRADVDHKDGVKDNNAWANLRAKGKSVNNRNRRQLKSNTSGHVGVSWDGERSQWAAHIGVDGKQIFLGRFDHFEDAVTARLGGEIKFGYLLDKLTG